jgi:signal transduction histidine kinase
MSHDPDPRPRPPGAAAGDRAKSALLSFVRHELRTPVNAVVGYSEMLIEDADALGRPDLVPDLRKLLDCGRVLLALINEAVEAESRASERPSSATATCWPKRRPAWARSSSPT